MSTLSNFRVLSAARPSETNSLKYAVYKASDPLAVVQSQTFAPPHVERTVNFLSLQRTNYIFRLFQVTGGGDVPLINDMNFTPDRDDLIYYAPVSIKADVTTGVVSGTTTFTFDGTAGTPDWRGRTLYIERVGQGSMEFGVQYTWDSVTGIFTHIETGVTFQPLERFVCSFDIIVQTSGITGTPLWSAVKVVTGTTTLVAGDIGKKIIVKGASPYFVITLPDSSVIPENIVTYIEFARASHTNVKILATGTTFDWGVAGTLSYITGGLCENLAIYKEPTTGVLRVHSYEGNFLQLGTIIKTDADISQLFNVQELDGSNMAFATYKRLYEDYVQKLPPAQVCNYTDWGTGDNKYKFSYSNGTNFRVPDRRNLYSKATDGTILAGTYGPDSVGPHNHPIHQGNSYTGSGGNGVVGRGANQPDTFNTDNNTGTATEVKRYIIREYILI